MQTLTIKTQMPCHQTRVRLSAIALVPCEVYDRQCPRCGFRWTITRHTVTERRGIRIDRLDWEQAHNG